MIYLIQQIILCLLFTALIGAAVGWLLRGMGSSRQSDAVDAQWRARVAHLESKNETPPATKADASANADTGALRQRLADSERELATLRTARAVRAHDNADTSRDELREIRIVCQQLQSRVAEQNTLNEQLKERLQMVTGEREALIERLRKLETSYAQLKQERSHAIETIAGLQKKLRAQPLARTAAGDAGPGGRSHAEAPIPATPTEKAVRRAAGAGSVEKPAPGSGDSAAVQQSLPMADIDDSPPADKPYEPAWRLQAPDGAPDNLQAVYGIGPKIQQRLNELGIFHFRQIAAFEKRDILWVATHLQSFPGRILRDRWVEQARSLEKRRRAGQPI